LSSCAHLVDIQWSVVHAACHHDSCMSLRMDHKHRGLSTGCAHLLDGTVVRPTVRTYFLPFASVVDLLEESLSLDTLQSGAPETSRWESMCADDQMSWKWPSHQGRGSSLRSLKSSGCSLG